MRWVTFDCFGTLVDWRHGISNGIDLLFPGRGAGLLDVYNRHEAQIQAQSPTLRYREVLTESLRRTAKEAGLDLLPDDADVLAATIPYWPVFSDTRAALTELRAAGWRIALLTNCDRDLIGETRRRLAVDVDAVITAEDVGGYKPGHAHFEHFADRFGVSTRDWVHVAQSHFHDIRSAHALGIRRVWVNRRDEPDDPSIADAVLPDLTNLPATVEKISSIGRP